VLKKRLISIVMLFSVITLLFPTSAIAGVGDSVITKTGNSVLIDEHFPKDLQENAVQFITEDDVLLSGIVLGKGTKGITLGHAMGWNVASWLPYAQKLVDKGYQVILWSYRNNEPSGNAEGDAYYRLDLDVLAAAQVLRERGVTEIMCMGASLGGTSSAVAAPNIPELVGIALLSSPRKFGVPPKISALEAVKTIKVPSFFAVSTDDPTGDYYSEVKALYEASASPQKQFVEIDDYAHGSDMLSETNQGVDLSNKLMKFIDETFTSTANEPNNEVTITLTPTPEASVLDETVNTPDNTQDNKNTDISSTPWLIGATVILMALLLVILKIIKNPKGTSKH